MKAWRMLAFLMIVVAALTLSTMRGARFFPAAAVAFGALGAWRRFETRLTRKQEMYLSLGLAVLFVVIPRIGARGMDDVALLWRTGLTLGHLFVLLMALCLFARSESGPPPRLAQ